MEEEKFREIVCATGLKIRLPVVGEAKRSFDSSYGYQALVPGPHKAVGEGVIERALKCRALQVNSTITSLFAPFKRLYLCCIVLYCVVQTFTYNQ